MRYIDSATAATVGATEFDWLSPSAAGDLLGIDKRTVLGLCRGKAPRLTSYRIPDSRSVRVSRADVEALAQEAAQRVEQD